MITSAGKPVGASEASVIQVRESAELASRSTSVNLLGTLGFGACGLLLLVVNGRNLSEQQPKGSPRAENSVGEAQVAATPIRTRVRKLREDSFACGGGGDGVLWTSWRYSGCEAGIRERRQS